MALSQQAGWLLANSKLFPEEKMEYLKKSCEEISEEEFFAVSALEYKDPTTMMLISIFLGAFGIDRFMIGQIGMGILKLFTGGLFGILWLFDIFSIGGLTKNFNFNKLQEILGNKVQNENNTKTDTLQKDFLKIIQLYEEEILSKEEFLLQKQKLWGQMDKRFNDVSTLKKLKTAYGNGLLTNEEYEEIKDITLNNPIITWRVKFLGFENEIEVQAGKNSSKEKIEEILREQKYLGTIENFYPLYK